MPPPKRPFTTSSLTSSLRSTLASQPLLNNLTNIDKLSSQASSLAQKAPFFSAINQQIQHHSNNIQHSQVTRDNTGPESLKPSTSSQANVAAGDNNFSNTNRNLSPNSSASADRSTSFQHHTTTTSSNNNSEDMNRDVHKQNGAPGGIRSGAPPMAPDVDLSHLTEEERAMIQSVMAKAEMADMGLPVDTSLPSSTNLPSSTSQALTQQRDQQQQQQQIRQQQQQKQQQQQQQRQQQQQFQGQQQANSVGPLNANQRQNTQPTQGNNAGVASGTQSVGNSGMQQNIINQTVQMSGVDSAGNNLYAQQRADQQLSDMYLMQRQQEQTSSDLNNNQMSQQQATATSTANSMPSLELQTQQLVNQINTQFNLGTPEPKYQTSMGMNSSNLSPAQNIGNTQTFNQYQVIEEQSLNMMPSPIAPPDMRQPLQQIQQNFNHLDQTQVQMVDYMQSQQLVNMPINQPSPMTPQFVPTRDPQAMGISTFGQSIDQQYADPRAGPFIQQQAKQMPQAQVIASQPSYISVSDFEQEHAFSDQDLKRPAGNRGKRSGGQSMSRHESVETKSRAARRSRNRDALELQAYDLAQQRTTPTHSHKSRQLPQPGLSSQASKQQSLERSSQSPNEFNRGDRPSSKNRESRRQVSDARERSYHKSRIAQDKKPVQNISSLTESDLDDDDIQTESEYDDRARHSPGLHKKKIDNVRNDGADGKTVLEASADKSDPALKLLKELKLTEQANQVMEQQQLLIKQSQELIKLQQFQLEQQAEINKTLSDIDRDKRSRSHRLDSERKKISSIDEEKQAGSDHIETKMDTERHSGDETGSTVRSISQDEHDKNNEKRALGPNKEQNSGVKSSARDSQKLAADNDSDTDAQSRRSTSAKLRDPSTSDRNRRKRQEVEENPRSSRHSPSSVKSRPMSTLTHKANRELVNQSPTDTTDSDVDLASQTSSRRLKTKAPVKSTPVARVRREPRGLPPSPLPVAAAIQLHQMQQRSRNQTALSNLSRANQIRSRSVTSSPNHLLDRMTSGYTTDTQRARPSSPDTMSEYGGMRRRKRLPEPPANVIPITPSMVRRMVQANRAAAANSERISNMNIGTSILPNRISRNTTLDRSSFLSGHRPYSNLGFGGVAPSSLLADSRQSTSGLKQTLPMYSGGSYNPSMGLISDRTTESDLLPKSSYNIDYSDSILKGTHILDVKETPELDKLISNLDEYYNLDGTSASRPSPSRLNSTSIAKLTSDYEPRLDRLSPIRSLSPVNALKDLDYPATSISQTRYSNPSHQPETTYNLFARQNSDLTGYPNQSNYNPPYYRQTSLDRTLNTVPSTANHVSSILDNPRNYEPPTSHIPYRSSYQTSGSALSDTLGPIQSQTSSRITDYKLADSDRLPLRMDPSARPPVDTTRNYYLPQTTSREQPPMSAYGHSGYTTSHQYNHGSDYIGQSTPFKSDAYPNHHQPNPRLDNPSDRYGSSTLASITKDDIINNGPKYNSIGYRFRTENQNKYVTELRTPIECLQSRYPYPYKRILLSKNPKDRLGNGIGVRIVGGRPLANIYDKVNKCILSSGAFVTEVFQSSRVYFMDEMHEGDQIIEWNGVNLCNRSDGEVQQILFSQFSDDEVEIIYLNKHEFRDAYGTDLIFDDRQRSHQSIRQDYSYDPATSDAFDVFSAINKPNSYNVHGHQVNEPFKRSIRRKLSLSSISHIWSK